MPSFSISKDAEADIDGIAEFTTSTWGWRQASVYLLRLEQAFEMLAANPGLGRSCSTIVAGLHRFEVGRHVVFYQVQSDDIFVVRILHQQMLPVRQRFQP